MKRRTVTLKLERVRVFRSGQAELFFSGELDKSGTVDAIMPLAARNTSKSQLQEAIQSSFMLIGEGVSSDENPEVLVSRWVERLLGKPAVYARCTVKGPPGAKFTCSFLVHGSAYQFSYAVNETTQGRFAITGFLHLTNWMDVALPPSLEFSLRTPVGISTNLSSPHQARYPGYQSEEDFSSGLVGRHARRYRSGGDDDADMCAMCCDFTETVGVDESREVQVPDHRTDLVPAKDFAESKTLTPRNLRPIPPGDSRWFSYVRTSACGRKVFLANMEDHRHDPRAHHAIWLDGNPSKQTLLDGPALVRFLQSDGSLGHGGASEVPTLPPGTQCILPYEIASLLLVRKIAESASSSIDSIGADNGRPKLVRNMVRSVTYRIERKDAELTGTVVIEHPADQKSSEIVCAAGRVEYMGGKCCIIVELGNAAVTTITVTETGKVESVIPRSDEKVMQNIFAALLRDPSRAKGVKAEAVAKAVTALHEAKVASRHKRANLDALRTGGPILATLVAAHAGAPDSAAPYVGHLERLAQHLEGMENGEASKHRDDVARLSRELEAAVDRLFDSI